MSTNTVHLGSKNNSQRKARIMGNRTIWQEHQDSNGRVIREQIPFEQLPLKIQRVWYHGICSETEIDRILNVQNGDDYILKLRADTIADNIRLWRVFHHIAEAWGKDWALEKYFNAYCYIDVRNAMSKDKQEVCKQVHFGSLISSNPNGLIFDTPYGICSTYSETLKYFTQFSCLALLDFKGDVPYEVRFNAMRIAIRVMLQTEALDFDVDPRGIIPQEIMDVINPIYPAQMTFLAAHEYSHLLNGDLDKGSLKKIALLQSHFKDQTDYKMLNAYTSDQKKEFAADLGAMTNPQWSKEVYSYQYFATMLWFAALAVYEAVENSMFPPYGRQSHPGAKARYNNILENAPRPYDFDKDMYCEDLPQLVSHWEEVMKEDVSVNYDQYEMYGSSYLAAPNTEWRGRELIDRVDY